MEIEITPLEEAILNAQDFSAGMAVSGMVLNLINRSEELGLIIEDRSLPNSARADALKERRDINLQLDIVASSQAVAGIGA